MSYQPKSVEDICRIVQESKHLSSRGGCTKRALAGSGTVLDMTSLSGIIDYQPNEYVFTAYAGAPLKEIRETLLKQGQFLPFDPLFIDDGATIGGTIAANTCGPGRYRYGGIRDYILRISIVDGEGRAFNGGEKVVKNAAGFDLPKFFVGSRSKFGVITEASFKVFPVPPASQVISVEIDDLQTALDMLLLLGRSSFDIHALDLIPENTGSYKLVIRISGLAKALPERCERLVDYLQGKSSKLTESSILTSEKDTYKWSEVISIKPAKQQEWLFQVAISSTTLSSLEQETAITTCERCYSCAANQLFIYTLEPERLRRTLQKHTLPFLILDGPGPIKQQLTESALPMYRKLKQVFDPKNRFGEL